MKLISVALAAAALLVPALASAAERLVVMPYPAEAPWPLATDQRQGVKMLREYVPADQTVDAYRDMLVVQAFPESRTVPPATFMKAMFSGVGYACEAVSVNGPKEGMEGGYKVAYGQIYCGHQLGKSDGAHIFIKMIQGKDAMYVVQREFRVPATKVAGTLAFGPGDKDRALSLMKDEAAANAFLVDSVFLCADGAAEARCAP
ncbi:MAG: hypothetical protein KF842_15085 [Caulobacter sp.]|nr:hypothetical protein [Caulobacter sp.]